MNKALADFYDDVSHNGASVISDVLDGDYAFIESTHNWCQRAFPNFEPSEVVAGAPVLDESTLFWLKETQMEKVYKLVFRYLQHYTHLDSPFHVSHNNRRVTRLLKYLVMLECPQYVIKHTYNTVLNTLLALHIEYSEQISLDYVKNTVVYWEEALKYKREEQE